MPKRTIQLKFPVGTDNPEKDTAAYKLFLKWLVAKIGIKSNPVTVSLVNKSAEKGSLSHHEFSENAKTIVVRYEGRAMIDIFRNLAHEFQHLKQYEEKPGGMWVDDSSKPDWAKEADAAAISGQLIKKFMADNEGCRWIYKH